MKLGNLSTVMRVVLLVMLGGFCTACQSYFDATPRVWNDIALMDDLHRFDLVKAATSDAQWIVAEITLKPSSHIPRGTMQPDGHMTVKLTVSGHCRVLDPLGSKPEKMEWDFEYEGYVSFGGSGGGGAGPFQVPEGVSILRWDSMRTDRGMFPEGYRLADGAWAAKVAEAWKVAQEQRPLFEPANAKANVNALGDMANQGNPLLTMAAFRTLAKGRVIAPSWGDFFIMNSQFPLQGVLMRDYLDNLDDAKVEEVSARFDSYLSNPRTVEEVEGIALAAQEINHVDAPAGHKVARRLMGAIGWRLGFMPGDKELRDGLIGLSHRWMFSD